MTQQSRKTWREHILAVAAVTFQMKISARKTIAKNKIFLLQIFFFSRECLWKIDHLSIRARCYLFSFSQYPHHSSIDFFCFIASCGCLQISLHSDPSANFLFSFTHRHTMLNSFLSQKIEIDWSLNLSRKWAFREEYFVI
jgi:hypothetical protein